MLTRDDLVGTWREAGAEFVTSDGTITPAWGALNARLMYNPDGYVAVISTPPDRVAVSGPPRPDLNEALPDELPDAVIVYTGRFVVDGDAVEHDFQIALSPNLLGMSTRRIVEFDGDDLLLLTPPDQEGTYRRVRWRREPAG